MATGDCDLNSQKHPTLNPDGEMTFICIIVAFVWFSVGRLPPLTPAGDYACCAIWSSPNPAKLTLAFTGNGDNATAPQYLVMEIRRLGFYFAN